MKILYDFCNPATLVAETLQHVLLVTCWPAFCTQTLLNSLLTRGYRVIVPDENPPAQG